VRLVSDQVDHVLLDDITKALIDKGTRAAKVLETTWLLELGTAALGPVYLVDTALAAVLAQNLKLEPPLIKIAVPFASIFLFAKMGYQLAVYLRTRAKLISRIARDSEPEDLEFATADHSLYYVLADLTVHTKPMTLASAFPWLVISVVAFGPYNFTNALSIYFLHSQFGSLTLTAISTILLVSFYVQFGVAMRPEIGRWSHLVFGSALVMLALTGMLFWWNPLA
jgi:hypothetical protein